MEDEAEYLERIANDVLAVLTARHFLEVLDDQMCPPDPAQPRAQCTGSYDVATSVLFQPGFESDDVADIIRVLQARRAHCDCEILLNVAENSLVSSQNLIKTNRDVINMPG